MKTIKPLRIKRRMKQCELAEKVGVVPTTLCNWERGKTEPKASELKKLAEIFDVSVAELLD